MRTYRLVFKSKTGKIQEKEYADVKAIAREYEQIGVEEDSYTVRLHGEPVFKGLIGPMSDGTNGVRYETPAAFVQLTEAWAKRLRNGKVQDEE